MDRAPSGVMRLRRVLTDIPESATLIVVIGMFIFWTLVASHFTDTGNLINIAQQISLLGIVATGMTFLLVAGELDLSVGSGYGFTAVLMALLVTNDHVSIVPAIVLTLLAGIGIGVFNGALTTYLSIPSFIVTLGMLGVLRGLALAVSGGLPVGPVTSGPLTAASNGNTVAGIPAQVAWLVGVLILGGLVLARSRFGYHVYASGGNRQAAVNSGINVRRTKILCFVVTGLLVALIGVLSVGYLGDANPLTGTGFELQVIAAVVIGGTSLFGGAGSVLGTLLGAAIIGMLNNGLVLVGTSQFWQQFATGAVILAAAVLNVIVRAHLLRRL